MAPPDAAGPPGPGRGHGLKKMSRVTGQYNRARSRFPLSSIIATLNYSLN
jgi:hypothetical protein